MAIHVRTDNPQQLLDRINEGIENQAIQTWESDSEGDFTHVSQWKEKAWLRPKVGDNELIFGLIGRKDESMKKLIYGIYHGRFAEMLLSHFDTMIHDIQLTSGREDGIDSFS